MLTELRKSIGYIIYERTTSPLWGAFIFSWLICNWKIVFTVFVVSESKLPINKIDYITANFINWKPLALYPFISMVILVTVFPLLSNGAYWITIIYSKWRIDKKNTVEKKQLLSIEQSIAIRISNSQIEESYNRLIGDKETEITSLKLEVEEIGKRLNQPSVELSRPLPVDNQKAEIEEWDIEYNQFKSSSKFNEFRNVLVNIAAGIRIQNYKGSFDSISYFESIDLIKKKDNSFYELTRKGLYFSKLFNKSKYEAKE